MATQRALFLFVFFQNLPGFEHPTTAPSEITLYRPASQPLHHRINSAHLAEIASYDMRIGTGEPHARPRRGLMGEHAPSYVTGNE